MRRQSWDNARREPAQVVVNGVVLVCKRTPAGTWVCCSEDDAPNCACGFTIDSAAANWLRAQQLAE